MNEAPVAQVAVAADSQATAARAWYAESATP